MSENITPENPPAENPAKPLPDAAKSGYALYDTAELRFLDGVYDTAAKARAAHKDRLVDGRTYEARQV